MTTYSATDHYEVRWRTKGTEEAWSPIATASAMSEIVITHLDRLREYEIQVRSVSDCGAKSIWVGSDYQVPTPPPPPGVGQPTANGTADGVQVDWSDGDSTRGDLTYELQRAPADRPYETTPPPETDLSWVRVAIVKGTSWTDPVTDVADYWYRLRAVDYAGNKGGWTIVSSPAGPTITTGGVHDEAIEALQLAQAVDLAAQAAQAAADAAQVDADAAQSYAQSQAASLQAQVDVVTGQIGDIMEADEWSASHPGGYPLGDLVQSGGYLYRSLKDDNTDALTVASSWEKIGQYTSLGGAVGDAVVRVSQAELDIGDQSTTLDLLGQRSAGKSTFVLNQSTIKIDNSTTLGQWISSVQANHADLSARVDNEETARTDADNALSLRIDSTAATLACNPNMLLNPDATDGTEHWEEAVAMPAQQFSLTNAGGPDYFIMVPTAGAASMVSQLVEVRVGTTYTFAVDTSSRNKDAIIYLRWVDDAGAWVGDGPFATVVNNWGRISSTDVCPVGATHAQCAIRCGGSDVQPVRWRRAKLETGAAATLYADDAGPGANAKAIRATNTTVGVLDGQVTANSSEIVSLTSQVGGKADASALGEYYTKSQTDDEISSAKAGLTQSFESQLHDFSQPGYNLVSNPAAKQYVEDWVGADGTLDSHQNEQGRYFTLQPYTANGCSASQTIPDIRAGQTLTLSYLAVFSSYDGNGMKITAKDATGDTISRSGYAKYRDRDAAGYSSTTWTTPSGTASLVVTYMCYQGTVSWSRVKLEFGDHRTAFSDDQASRTNARAIESISTAVTQQGGKISTQASKISSLQTTQNGHTSSINAHASSINGLRAQASLTMDVNGKVSGIKASSTSSRSDIVFDFDHASFVGSNNRGSTTIEGGNIVIKNSAGKTVVAIGINI